VTRPVIITRDGGVASISEGGYKARPMSPAPQEISVSLVHLQKQFAIAQLVLMISRMGGDTQVVKQFKLQLKMATKAMADQVGDYFYCGSSGILATTDTDLVRRNDGADAANGFNQSFITNAAYLANLFKSTGGVIGRGGRLRPYPRFDLVLRQVSNAIGQVTSVPHERRRSLSRGRAPRRRSPRTASRSSKRTRSTIPRTTTTKRSSGSPKS
jgi:hypothetical protein